MNYTMKHCKYLKSIGEGAIMFHSGITTNYTVEVVISLE